MQRIPMIQVQDIGRNNSPTIATAQSASVPGDIPQNVDRHNRFLTMAVECGDYYAGRAACGRSTWCTGKNETGARSQPGPTFWPCGPV